MDYKKLQNGSDIRGIAMENEWGDPVNLTGDAVRHLAAAFVRWLRERTGKETLRIAVGRDSRLTGEALTKDAIAGMCAEGAQCTDCGLASTPAMFMTTVLEPYCYDGSIMMTASHLPYHRNGMKFFTPEGGLESKDIKALIQLAEEDAEKEQERRRETAKATGRDASTRPTSSDAQDEPTRPTPSDARDKSAQPTISDAQDKPARPTAAAPEADQLDFMSVYSAHLCDIIKKGIQAEDYAHPLKGLHVIVDAGNGASGFFEEKVLRALGADTAGSQFLAPDGRFPNHIPNPENKEAAASIREATLRAKADLGIIFDTDGDRAGAVLSDGKTLTRNALIAALSRIALNEHPGTTIVTDSVTSNGLADFIRAHGGVHRRFKRGYRNVINESIRLNGEGVDSQLAIETSGHGAWKENYFLDDGAYLMVKLLIEMGKGHKLAEMIADLKEPKESVELRFAVTSDDAAKTMENVLQCLDDALALTDGWEKAPENYEGIRVNCDASAGNGWFLLRKSLHEPIMPLNLESDDADGCRVMAGKLYDILKTADGLDLKPLTDYVG